MIIFFYFVEFFRSFHIQLLIAELMFAFLLKPRLKKYQIFIIIVAYCAIPFIIDLRYFDKPLIIGEWFTFGFIIVMLASVGVIWLCFKVKSFKELLFYCIAAIVVQHMVYSVGRAVNLALGIVPSRLFYNILVISFFVIYGLFYIVFVRRFKKDNSAVVRNAYIISFSVFAAFFVYILSLWTTRKEILTIGSFLFDTFCCILLLVVHFGMFEWSKMEKQNEIMKHILQVEKEKHTLSKENIELINMKFHDFKYQISALKHHINSDEHIESIKEIERATKIYDTSVQTGNDTLDVLLYERSLLWDKHNINFTCIADGSKLDFMLPSDIYSLFGNALDNAIESVKKIDDEEKRIISLNIISKINYVVINLYNYFEHELSYEQGLPVTTKAKNGYHGYGLKSIRYLTEKYNGNITINAENEIFRLNIIIPIKKKIANKIITPTQ